MGPGVTEIYDEKELLNSLALLIQNNHHVSRWFLKIDNESHSRGLAVLQVDNWKAMKIVLQSSNDMSSIKQLLQNQMPRRLVIQSREVYSSYSHYLKHYSRNGGIIEACPVSNPGTVTSASIAFRIDPDGSASLLGTYQKMSMLNHVNFGCLTPQTALPKLNA